MVATAVLMFLRSHTFADLRVGGKLGSEDVAIPVIRPRHNQVSVRDKHSGCHRVLVSLEHRHAVDCLTKVPKSKCGILATSYNKPLTCMSRTVSQLIVMASQLLQQFTCMPDIDSEE